MDFTALLSSLTSQSGPLGIALAAIAGVLILPSVARWGYDQVVGWFDDREDHEDDESHCDELYRCYYCANKFSSEELHSQGNGIHVCAECFDYTSEHDE